MSKPLPAKVQQVNAQQIAEALLGRIEWERSDYGYCECPGVNYHTSKNGRRDCDVHLDGAPTIFCQHTSCKGEVEKANYELRKAIGKLQLPEGMPKVRTLEQIQRDIDRERKQQLKLRAAASLNQIIEQHSISEADMLATSPVNMTDRCLSEDWRALLQLFKPDDVLWMGRDVYQKQFKTVSQWLTSNRCPGNFTCPSTFKPGSESRSNDNVLHRRYLVVESDELKKTEMLAVIQWLRKTMRLRAVVDTGGKSLHGWFEFPPEDILNELKSILPALKCDPKLFTASQPCRLPGAIRNGCTCQFLIWLDWEGIQ
ncbi:MAG: hypothetical protein ACK4UN_05955 [Limisphaerales bacterium]